MIKVAITGASGFIGQYLMRELAKHSVKVVLAVRHHPSKFVETDTLKVVEFDISQTEPDPFTLLGNPDVLIHLAWGGLPDYTSPHHFERELPMQYTFLSQLVKSGLKSLVVTGTCFEYGMISGSLHETRPPQPANPYGYAKYALNQQLTYLQKSIPFSLTWCRLFYLYGAEQSTHSIYTQLCNSVKQGNAVFNMSGGEQLRDYLPVEKVAQYITDLALIQDDIGLVNICSGKPISIRKLVEDWIQVNNWNIDINLGYYPYPDYEPMAFWGDNSKLNSLINRP